VALGALTLLLCAVAVPGTGTAPRPPTPRPPATPPSPGFSEILPPGQSGFTSLPAFLQWENDGTCEDFGPHFCDRLGPYLGWQWDESSFRSRDRVDPGDTVETLRSGRVRIVRDAATGAPHIWGDPDAGMAGQAAADSSAANLAYGAGVTEAEDRLFQMDVFRRAAEGRLSDLVGTSYLRYDEEYRRDAETDAERAQDAIQHLTPGDLAALDAYVAGVNDVIQRVTTNPTQLPAEFTLLQDLPIKPWTREDSLAIGTLELKAEAEAGGQELVAAAALQKIAGAGRGLNGANGVLQDWYFRQDPAAPASVPGTRPGAPPGEPDVYPFTDADSLARLSSLPADLASMPEAGVSQPGSALAHVNDIVRTIDTLGLPRFGSNAVAVAPQHTTFGGALLYGGPQAGYSVPAVFVRMEVHAVGIDVEGVAVPGSGPVVVIGHTPHHAWSLTTGQDDQVDTYTERVRKDPGDPSGNAIQVLVNGTWQPVETRTETYCYRTVDNPLPPVSSVTPPVYATATTTVYRTVHAGIPSPIIALRWDPNGSTGWALSKTRSFWNTAAQMGRVFEGIMRAQSLPDFAAAVDGTTVAFNFPYADADGHIGYWHAGDVPLRAKGQDPRLPAPGDGSFEWRGMLPHSYWPHVVDPAQGWVASWNNRAALDFPDSGDGTVWGPNQRVLGIQRDLAARLARGPIDAAGLADVMRGIGSHDLRSTLFFRDILLRLQQPRAPHLSDAARQALDRVASWNGDVYYPFGSGPATVKDAGATVFGRWFTDLEDAVLRPVFEPAAPTPWSVDSFDDATTGAADGGRDEFFDNLTPVVLHAVESTSSIPLHLDWLPPSATGSTHDARVDSLAAAALERAVGELAAQYKTADQTKWLDPTHTTTYMSESAADLPPQPFENRGVYGLLAAFPAPPGGAANGVAAGRSSVPLGRLPATGGSTWPSAAAALAVLTAGLFLRRRRA
jgi:penicillin G amidase